MNNNSSNGSSGTGISTVGLIGVVLVTLKLLHKIGWSWWLVTLPFWGGAALVALILGTAFGVIAVGEVRQERRRRRAIERRSADRKLPR